MSTLNIPTDVDNKQPVNGPNSNMTSSNGTDNVQADKLTTEDIYKMARDFVKDKEGSKAIQLSYDDRNRMNVLTKQINARSLDEEQSKVGFLDLVGKDRIQLWKSLGNLSKEDAMKKYIELITKICPLFHAHIEAHKSHLEEVEQRRRKLIEEEEQLRKEMTEQKEKKLKEEDLKQLEESKKRREEIQRKQIQEALNQQTFPHFKAYAEQQHPNHQQAQEELIKQLQEQHFEQYMNQVYQQQLVHQQQQAEQLRAMKRAQKKTNSSVQPDEAQFKNLSLGSTSTNMEPSATLIDLEPPHTNIANNQSTQASNTGNKFTEVNINEESASQATAVDSVLVSNPVQVGTNPNGNNNNFGQSAFINGDDGENLEDDEDELPPISAASMLTRKDIKEFKEGVRKDNDAIIKVGSGETVTVRVPTHEDGRLIFWEFSTDFYDLGFGLYFEWTLSPSSNVTVHVSDSSDDDEDTEGVEGYENANKHDIESGDQAVDKNKPPCDEIIPIFRRDCHEEVYAGSHLYPGRGVYLLKFDNSYSLWRSKTLYYRVYYSK